MTELSIETRIKIIKKLGMAINVQFQSNCTEELVIELVLALDPGKEAELMTEHYGKYMAKPLID